MILIYLIMKSQHDKRNIFKKFLFVLNIGPQIL